ncbi:probable protein phosphatase 2C 8 isoform X2 [Eucalyptus grandis]|uniref:probable protein phosphatase 2C 8 isoform X2 n=1 Tax=Eucalyptus grandis TaxID=71139 RepID=UPI00192EBDBC|nr:probable protein phosphatase 2C 8 isoform X2 [Eucalyptus grandis]
MESFVEPPEQERLLALDGCALKRKRGAPEVTSSEKVEDGPLGPAPVGGDGGVGEGDARGLTCLSHGSMSVIGRRRSMEDAVTVARGAVAGKLGCYDFFGVYDGHGGANVANACRDRLHKLLVKEMEGRADVCGGDGGGESEWRKVMEASFGKMDEEVGGKGVDASTRMAGSTAVVAVVGKEEVVVANCGDSRAVLCRGDVAVPLSVDHKPDRPDEKERVEAAGGRIIDWNGSRVLGVLATSRSIGDYYLKPFVIAEPEVTVVRRCLNGRIKRRFPEELRGSNAAEAAAVLAELAMARGSQDNISVIVVELKKPNSKSP